MKIKKNILLKNYTSFKIGGPAKYFVEVKSKQEIIYAAKWAKQNNLPFFVLGEGSNLLVSDNGYDGLVIKIQMSNVKCPAFVKALADKQVKSLNCKAVTRSEATGSQVQNPKILAEAGAKLETIVKLSADQGLTGMEWAAGIPGTIAGAICGNAAAFGQSMADIVESVEILDVRRPTSDVGRRDNRNNGQCQFAEKNSVFKQNKGIIILSAVLKLKKGNKDKIKSEIKNNLEHRKFYPKQPSAGCVFINPKNHSAGQLIDQAGLRGRRIGNAQISENHANFIVNLGSAKAGDVKKLIDLAKQKVKKKFSIELKEEIQVINN